MHILLRLTLGLLVMFLLVWLPRAGRIEAQIDKPRPKPTPRKARPTPTPTPTPAPTPSVEKAVWNAIKNSTDPAVFDRFLNDYPNGEFASEARARVIELRRPWPTLIVRSFEFETVRLDKNGKEIERRKGQARYFSEDLGNGVKLEMVEIPGGRFQMGSPTNDILRGDDEGGEPHPVTVVSFWMGKFEVTQAQWRAVMGSWPNVRFGGSDLPVERVSWNDVQEFLKKLNDKANLQGVIYRLPSEAEWEYAARAGTTKPFAFGETITTKYVNYNYNDTGGKTVPVGSLGVANAFGLYDMHGNVWEWCQDYWHGNYSDAPSDGSAWLSNRGDSSYRVVRGGSWSYYSWNCRSAARFRSAPSYTDSNIGFRVVLARAQ
jgi:formylglycine-generating enzyme required for sulfatase activity